MADDSILIKEVIGKTITDIRCKYGMQDGWLDTAECFIQLDQKFYIEIPYGLAEEIFLVEPGPEVKTIFGDLSDISYYHLEEKTIIEGAEVNQKRSKNIFTYLRKTLFGYDPPTRKYAPYKVEYYENKLKFLINRIIVDYLWGSDKSEKGFFELDNGYLISDRHMAPHGTGLAGLHYYDSIKSLEEKKGDDLKRYSESIRDSRQH